MQARSSACHRVSVPCPCRASSHGLGHPGLGIMLGLAVGIDFSLFIVHRHRRQLMEGYRLHGRSARGRHLRDRRRLRRLDRLIALWHSTSPNALPGVMGCRGSLRRDRRAGRPDVHSAMLGLIGERVLRGRALRACRPDRPAPTRPCDRCRTGERSARPAGCRPAPRPGRPAMSMRLGLPTARRVAVLDGIPRLHDRRRSSVRA